MTAAVLHLVTPAADPRVGGMETSVMRIGAHLADAGARVFVYGLHDDDEAAAQVAPLAPAGVTHVPLGIERRLLADPVDKSGVTSLPFESYQIDYALLIAAVRRRINEHRAARHLFISFFVTYAGWVAQRVADELDIRHIASVRGSDLTRDY